MKKEDFGITFKFWKKSLIYSLIITLLGACIIAILGYYLGFKSFSIDFKWAIFYAFVSVPLQELVFRGLVQTHLYRIGTNKAIIISSALFASIHFSIHLLLILTLLAGLSWGYLFSKYRTLLGPIVSHIILGILLFTLIL